MFFFILEARCPIFENVKLEVNLEASGKRCLPCSFDGVDRSIRLWRKRTNFRRRRDLEIE
jgi:hypothetical protein